MIKLQTPVTDEKCRIHISYNDRIMLMGSCFSDNIGKQLENYGFDVMINPFGTLYNPTSILNSIKRIINCNEFTEDDCIRMGSNSELICSFHHHTSFARKDIDEFLANANQKLVEAHNFFKSCNKLIITLGTSWYFRHIEKDMIVSNCLKRDNREFVRERMAVEQISHTLQKIADCGKEIIFTVSPIRHFKDGAHGNQLSKSALLLGIDSIRSDKTDYFPAYEIMMDELRDYRFYASDMLHPSEQAVEYISNRFFHWALCNDDLPRLEENIRRFKQSQHRTLHHNTTT